MSFKKFKDKFDEVYSNDGDGSDQIYLFMDDLEIGKNPLNVVLEEDRDDIKHDSYGHENSDLDRVYKLPDFGDILVQFLGNRSSYQGEDWYSFKEVHKVEKVVKVYEYKNK